MLSVVFPWNFPFFLFSTEEKRLVVQAGTNLQLTYGTYDILLTFYDRRGLDLQRRGEGGAHPTRRGEEGLGGIFNDKVEKYWRHR